MTTDPMAEPMTEKTTPEMLNNDVLLCARNTLGQVFVDGLEHRNVYIGGHRTSMRLEPAMWEALEEVAKRKNCTIDEMCSAIETARPDSGGLSSAVRVFLLEYYRLGSQAL
ncbi:MAG: ribbon-helix-helix domain-containing protein [Micavibrio sp.]|nr:ribbon-helix-helix domain-containing protein [Micavibrio sp.]